MHLVKKFCEIFNYQSYETSCYESVAVSLHRRYNPVTMLLQIRDESVTAPSR